MKKPLLFPGILLALCFFCATATAQIRGGQAEVFGFAGALFPGDPEYLDAVFLIGDGDRHSRHVYVGL